MGYEYPRIPVGSSRRVRLNQVSNYLLKRIVFGRVNLKDLEYSNNPLPNMNRVRSVAEQLLVKRKVLKWVQDGK